MGKVKTYFKDAKFSHESLLTISRAGAGLFKWVQAMVNYSGVAKGVEPKRKKVAEAEKSLRAASKDLAKTQEEVISLNAQLATLNTQFAEKSSEQQDLKAKADLMERRLKAASKLIDGLSSERTRWTRDMQARAHWDGEARKGAHISARPPSLLRSPSSPRPCPAGAGQQESAAGRRLPAHVRVPLVHWRVHLRLPQGDGLRSLAAGHPG